MVARRGFLALSLASILALPGLVDAQRRAVPSVALPTLRAGLFDPRPAVPSAPVRIVVAGPKGTAPLVAALVERGVPVLGVLPPLWVLVAADEQRLADVPGIRAQLGWPAAAAIVRELATLSPTDGKVAFPGGVPVVASFVSSADLAAITARLADAGVAPLWVEPTTEGIELGLRFGAGQLPAVRSALAEEPALVWADLQPPVRLRNGASAWRCQSGAPGHTPVFDGGLDGSGQVIAIMDTGIDADHCFFVDSERGLPPVNDDTSTEIDPAQRKILAVDFYWSADWPDPSPAEWDDDDQGHGTHVAGSAAGDAGQLGLHDGDDGMAPAAMLVIQDGGSTTDDCADLPGLGCPVRPLGPMLEQAWEQGARIHSNSWGDEENALLNDLPLNRYTERTADIDRFVWDHPEMIVVFAAGNSGSSGDGTVGSPATGKNVVAVGASTHGDVEPPCPAWFSSRGWTADGRIKPDVLAPGSFIVSAFNDGSVVSSTCLTRPISGTSMACPTVAGLAALVRQYFVDGFHPSGQATAADGFEPSAALVKATLIAAAVDVQDLGCSSARPAPSPDQGWGLVQLDRALLFAGQEHRLTVVDRRSAFASADDGPALVRVRLQEPGPLKVVLAWSDPPSSSAAAVNLVNDLDLEVAGPDGRWMGNVFVNGRSVAGGAPDRLNNVEVVWLPEAVAGDWTIRVRPASVGISPQGYALVVTGPLAATGPRAGAGRLGG